MVKGWSAATGVDLSSISIERRSALRNGGPHARSACVRREHLLFPDDTFDVVYSYGVMHHSPDTPQCIREAWRVLKPGGALRIMIYHHASLTGLCSGCATVFCAASLCVSPFAITWKVQAPSPTREKKRARCCRASSN